MVTVFSFVLSTFFFQPGQLFIWTFTLGKVTEMFLPELLVERRNEDRRNVLIRTVENQMKIHEHENYLVKAKSRVITNHFNGGGDFDKMRGISRRDITKHKKSSRMRMQTGTKDDDDVDDGDITEPRSSSRIPLQA